MKKQVTKTLIASLLRESVFNPKTIGPLSIILEAHPDDPHYLENRAIELVKEAQMAIRDLQPDSYHEKIQKAISLLTIARGIRISQSK